MSTLKDIALKANISVTTVCDVLNGKSKQRRVSDKVTSLVFEIASELNYKPHVHASALANQKTFLIGLIAESLHTSFWGDIVAGFLDEMESKNYRVIVNYSKSNLDISTKAFEDLISRQVDGIAFIGGPVPDLGQSKNSVVTSHQIIKNASSVVINQEFGVKLALDHLIEKGHKKILIIGNNSKRGKMSADYLKSKPVLFKNIEFKNINKELTKEFTAGFCTCDELAIETMTYLQNAGIRIGDDFSLVGFDNIKMASIVYPKLTSVDQPKKLYGQKLALQLIHLLNGGEISNIELLPTLAIRDSVKELKKGKSNE
jgi:LacI family transcriptional regulator